MFFSLAVVKCDADCDEREHPRNTEGKHRTPALLDEELDCERSLYNEEQDEHPDRDILGAVRQRDLHRLRDEGDDIHEPDHPHHLIPVELLDKLFTSHAVTSGSCR